MEMRTAEVVAGLPFGEHHVHAGLRRIADHDGLLDAAGRIALPLNIFGQLLGHSGGIEFGRGCGPEQSKHQRGSDNTT
jgi:hypothetical protein